MSARLLPETERHLTELAVRAQIATRTPGFVAGVARRGELLWHRAIGAADLSDPDVPLGPDTQYPVASNTKTFTAVLVLQLRDEGRLDLDDRIGEHLPELTHGRVTIRQMLAHASGMQREPVGDVWDTLRFPDRAGLLESWNAAERVLPAHHTWHYSNLCYAMLGELVARLDGGEWADSLRRRLLEPLGLTRTSLTLQPPYAAAYYVGPYTDVPTPEPTLDKAATAAAGSICSTLGDMVRWHGFLIDPDPAVLQPDSLAEMRAPQILSSPDWSHAWGLGMHLVRRDGRTWFGHTGGLPGAISGFYSEPQSGLTAAVLMNSTSATAPDRHALDLGAHVCAAEPELPQPWTPGTTEPAEAVELTGRWFSEGVGFTFVVRQGRLAATVDGAADSDGPDDLTSYFEIVGIDVWRTVSGRERGERLVVHRDGSGAVRQVNWATYKFTREPMGFAAPE